MTNLNEATIAAPSQSPNGTQIAITDTATSGAGQTILVVPGDQNQWAEVTIEACNATTTDFCLSLQWGATDVSGLITKKITALAGVSIVVDGRPVRGGTTIGARCVNATATGVGTSGAINVYVRPPLLYKRDSS